MLHRPRLIQRTRSTVCAASFPSTGWRREGVKQSTTVLFWGHAQFAPPPKTPPGSDLASTSKGAAGGTGRVANNPRDGDFRHHRAGATSNGAGPLSPSRRTLRKVPAYSPHESGSDPFSCDRLLYSAGDPTWVSLHDDDGRKVCQHRDSRKQSGPIRTPPRMPRRSRPVNRERNSRLEASVTRSPGGAA